MIIVFVIAQLKKDNSIVDIAWGPGFFLITLLQILIKDSHEIKDFFLTGMIFIWASRLSIHIYLRSKGKGEDFRYAQWRKDWGSKAFINAFVRVFMLQGIIMLFISLPIMIIFYNKFTSLSSFNIIGIFIFIIGFVFESIGDFQLYRFKNNSDNKGKIIKSGLWKITRHPNYFGEAVLWWGIGIYTIGMDLFYIALIGPLMLNLLILFVSGVPLLEKKYEGNPEWEDYKKITPAFIPFFGKKG
jgi:steroid 5-alpha reductase family enzyme